MRLIDADALIRDFPIRLDHYDRAHGNIHFVYGIESVMEYVDDMPTIDAVEVVRGEWIRNFDGNEWFWYCSNCKTQYYEEDLWMGDNEFPNYCPHCGAKMKGADDESV